MSPKRVDLVRNEADRRSELDRGVAASDGNGDTPPAVATPRVPLSAFQRFVVSVLVTITSLAAVLRIWDPDRWKGVDGTALLYVGVVCVAVCAPQLAEMLKGFKTVKFGTDGITLEQFEQVKETAKLAADGAARAQAQAAISRRVLRERLVKPATPAARGSERKALPAEERPAAADTGSASRGDDPQHGRWGGRSEDNGRVLEARFRATEDPEWTEVLLTVSAMSGAPPLAGAVVFHLHDTFADRDPVVPVTDGRAELTRLAWGAFTVGAEADGGETRLELDLATLPDAPALFRSR